MGTYFDINGTAIFQSTHPCGVRHAKRTFCCCVSAISINAPLRNAISANGCYFLRCYISINAPLWSATKARIDPSHSLFISINTPLRDATMASSFLLDALLISINAPLRDATNADAVVPAGVEHFNQRTLEGCGRFCCRR